MSKRKREAANTADFIKRISKEALHERERQQHTKAPLPGMPAQRLRLLLSLFTGPQTA